MAQNTKPIELSKATRVNVTIGWIIAAVLLLSGAGAWMHDMRSHVLRVDDRLAEQTEEQRKLRTEFTEFRVSVLTNLQTQIALQEQRIRALEARLDSKR